MALPDNILLKGGWEWAKVIAIYDARTGSTEIIAKAIEEGREKVGVEVISKGTANAKDIDDQPTAWKDFPARHLHCALVIPEMS